MWYKALGHGLLTSLEGAVSYGVGAITAQFNVPKSIWGKAAVKYVEATFTQPFNFLLDLIMEYLL